MKMESLRRRSVKYLQLLTQSAEHFNLETLVKSVGNKLLLEGLDYNYLIRQRPEMLMSPEGSHHLNYVFHNELIPPFISIHFREGLKELAELQSIEGVKKFLKNLEEDFSQLAEEFKTNPKLKNVADYWFD